MTHHRMCRIPKKDGTVTIVIRIGLEIRSEHAKNEKQGLSDLSANQGASGIVQKIGYNCLSADDGQCVGEIMFEPSQDSGAVSECGKL